MHVQVLILGAGPAGLTAGLYAALAGFQTIILSGEESQIILTNEVENFPGYLSVSGLELLDIMKKQIIHVGAKVYSERAVIVRIGSKPFYVKTDAQHEFEADSLIVATGSSAKWLGVPGEEKYKGHGISICATCDGYFYRQKEVTVIGGGDSAAYEALFLSKICQKVYLIMREFVADKGLQIKVKKTPNIKIISGMQILSFSGGEKVEAVHFKSQETGEQFKLPIQGVFEAIGSIPNSQLFLEKLKIDDNGYILVDCLTQRSSVPFVYACGDVASPLFRQAILAAASGCRAILDLKKYLT